jgi:hypothetical protein
MYRVRSATRSAAGERTRVCGEPGVFVGVEKLKSGITTINIVLNWKYRCLKSQRYRRRFVLVYPRLRYQQMPFLHISLSQCILDLVLRVLRVRLWTFWDLKCGVFRGRGRLGELGFAIV